MGEKMLIERLRLPYDDVKVILHRVQVRKDWWSHGKALAIEAQNEPFLHIDSDAYFVKPPPKWWLLRGVMIQSVEEPGTMEFNKMYSIPLAEMDATLPVLPDFWERRAKTPPMAYNVGVVGGNDLEAIQQWINVWRLIVEDNRNRDAWDALAKTGSLKRFVQLVEQYTCFRVMYHRGTDVASLFTTWERHRRDKEAAALGYAHAMSAKRRPESVFCTKLPQRVQETAPDLYDAVEKLFEGQFVPMKTQPEMADKS